MHRLGMRFHKEVQYPLGAGVEYVLHRDDPGPKPAQSVLEVLWKALVPDPVSLTVASSLPSDRPTLAAAARLRCRGRSSVNPPVTKRAPTTRAIKLAKATVTSIFGLRASICTSHDPVGAPCRRACRITAWPRE